MYGWDRLSVIIDTRKRPWSETSGGPRLECFTEIFHPRLTGGPAARRRLARGLRTARNRKPGIRKREPFDRRPRGHSDTKCRVPGEGGGPLFSRL